MTRRILILGLLASFLASPVSASGAACDPTGLVCEYVESEGDGCQQDGVFATEEGIEFGREDELGAQAGERRWCDASYEGNDTYVAAQVGAFDAYAVYGENHGKERNETWNGAWVHAYYYGFEGVYATTGEVGRDDQSTCYTRAGSYSLGQLVDHRGACPAEVPWPPVPEWPLP